MRSIREFGVDLLRRLEAAEVCRAARKAGMTYGQYVAKYSVSGADLQRRA